MNYSNHPILQSTHHTPSTKLPRGFTLVQQDLEELNESDRREYDQEIQSIRYLAYICQDENEARDIYFDRMWGDLEDILQNDTTYQDALGIVLDKFPSLNY